MAEATYAVATIAQLLNITPRRVQQLAREGVIPRAENGRYALVGSVQGYVKYLQERAVSGDTDEGTQRERRRLVKMQADKLEFEIGRLTSELVPTGEVGRAWARLTVAFRARMLALPSRLAAELAAEADPNVVKARLEDEIHDALEELSRDEALVAAPARAASGSPPNGAGDGEAAAAPVGERVG